jgi:hypothetical protein
MAKDEIYEFGKDYAFKCAGCGTTEGPFKYEGDAKLMLATHKIGCKKSDAT